MEPEYVYITYEELCCLMYSEIKAVMTFNGPSFEAGICVDRIRLEEYIDGYAVIREDDLFYPYLEWTNKPAYEFPELESASKD